MSKIGFSVVSIKRKTGRGNLFALVIICATVFIAGLCHCDKATGSFAPVVPTIPAGNFLAESYHFVATSDSIVMTQFVAGCSNDSLVSYYPNRFSYHYTLTEPNLLVTLKDSVSKACTTRFFAMFNRVSGSGLQGKWLFDSTWYVYKGKPGSADSACAATLKKNYVTYGYKWMMLDSDNLNVYHNSDTTTFVWIYKTYNKKMADSLGMQLDSIQQNAVRLICTHSQWNASHDNATSVAETLLITNYYGAGKTVFRTTDTTKYFPDPYVYCKDSVCVSRSLPIWWSVYIGKSGRIISAPYPTLTVTYPDTSVHNIKGGNTMNIQWQYPDGWPYKYMRVAAGIPIGGIMKYTDISTQLIAYPQTSFLWSVPDTNADSCLIKVYDSNGNKIALSAIFGITK